MFKYITGRLPIHTGLQHMVITAAEPEGLPLELPTLPEKLKEVGYGTHMIGKLSLLYYIIVQFSLRFCQYQ